MWLSSAKQRTPDPLLAAHEHMCLSTINWSQRNPPRCFCYRAVAVAKAHLSMPATSGGLQSTDSLGFSCCAIDWIVHNMGAVQLQRRTNACRTTGPQDHTRNAQRPMLNTTINWCCGTRLKAEYQWTPLQRVPSASHLLQSRSAPVVG